MSKTQTMTLGQFLKNARLLKEISLRALEQETGISNAYLSQLENDKAKNPSMDILYKLANIYGIDYNQLLVLSGLIEQKTESTISFGEYAFSKENLTLEEEEELLNYLQFLRQKKRKK